MPQIVAKSIAVRSMEKGRGTNLSEENALIHTLWEVVEKEVDKYVTASAGMRVKLKLKEGRKDTELQRKGKRGGGEELKIAAVQKSNPAGNCWPRNHVCDLGC